MNHLNIARIHEFYEKLGTNVQSLDTMGKLDEIKGYVRLTLDKLPCIRADLVRTDDGWQDWNFLDLLEALRKWTERNPCSAPNTAEQSNFSHNHHSSYRREKLLKTSQTDVEVRNNCIFCDESGHKAFQCQTIVSIEERRKIISGKKLCFNCLGRRHSSCRNCDGRHHTSICDKLKTDSCFIYW